MKGSNLLLCSIAHRAQSLWTIINSHKDKQFLLRCREKPVTKMFWKIIPNDDSEIKYEFIWVKEENIVIFLIPLFLKIIWIVVKT